MRLKNQPILRIKPLSFLSYDSTKVPNDKEKDERSRQKYRVFSKLLEALNSSEIEGQNSRKESVATAVQNCHNFTMYSLHPKLMIRSAGARARAYVGERQRERGAERKRDR